MRSCFSGASRIRRGKADAGFAARAALQASRSARRSKELAESEEEGSLAPSSPRGQLLSHAFPLIPANRTNQAAISLLLPAEASACPRSPLPLMDFLKRRWRMRSPSAWKRKSSATDPAARRSPLQTRAFPYICSTSHCPSAGWPSGGWSPGVLFSRFFSVWPTHLPRLRPVFRFLRFPRSDGAASLRTSNSEFDPWFALSPGTRSNHPRRLRRDQL